MGRLEGDFEKGLNNGAEEVPTVIGAAILGWEFFVLFSYKFYIYINENNEL